MQGQGTIDLSQLRKPNFSSFQQNDYFAVQGSNQFIQSDEIYQVRSDCAYEMKITYKCSASQRLFVGFKSYDSDMEEIPAYCQNRVNNSNVVFDSYDPITKTIKLTQQTKQNGKFWNQFVHNNTDLSNAAHLRMIGFYNGDHTNTRPKSNAVLRYPHGANDTDPSHSIYTTVDCEQGVIYLTSAGDAALNQYVNSGGRLVSGETILMNHTSGGTYDYMFTQMINNTNWDTYQTTFKCNDCQHASNIVLRTGTKYIRPIILANWDAQSPNAWFYWKGFTIEKVS